MNKLLSTLDGLVNLLAITNLGVNELSNKITSRTFDKVDEKGIVKNPNFYTFGWFLGITTELSFLIFSIYELIKDKDFIPLSAYAGIKLLGRSTGTIYTHKK